MYILMLLFLGSALGIIYFSISGVVFTVYGASLSGLSFESNMDMDRKVIWTKLILISLFWPIGDYIDDIICHFSIGTNFRTWPFTYFNKDRS